MEQESLHKSIAKNLGQYKISEPINRGSSGYVYLIQEIHTPRVFALKTLSKTLCTHSQHNLKHQINIHRNLKNQFIVRFWNNFQDQYSVYIVLEYCPGGNLNNRIQQSKLSIPMIRSYGQQIGKGLLYLHKNHIMHGDVKPHNILLTEEDSIKLCDFGYSADLSTYPGGKVRFSRGTKNYLAPEILLPHDQKVDIWAFGCVLYEMAMQHTPFTISDGKAFAKALTEQNTKKIKYDEQVLTPEFIHLLKLIFVVDPADRIAMEDILNHPFFTGKKLEEGSKQPALEAAKIIKTDRKWVPRAERIFNQKENIVKKANNPINEIKKECRIRQNLNKETNQNEKEDVKRYKKDKNKRQELDRGKVIVQNKQLQRFDCKKQSEGTFQLVKPEVKRMLSPLVTKGMQIKPVVIGNIEIRIDGEGFTREDRAQGGLWLNIRPNGSEVTLKKGSLLRSFHLDKLPTKYHRHYDECKKTVRTIQNETIKAQAMTPGCKVRIMWSGRKEVEIGKQNYHNWETDSVHLPQEKRENVDQLLNALCGID